MSSRTDPTTPERAGDGALALRSLAGRARTSALRVRVELRRADRFTRMRIGIVAVWAVLSLATLWGACGSPDRTSSLGAEVRMNGDSIMGVQLLVRNESSRIWEDVVLTLDGGWRYTHTTMRPHDLVVLPIAGFRRGDEAPPSDYRPRTLTIACGRASDRFELH
jgi:hypothetical protein